MRPTAHSDRLTREQVLDGAMRLTRRDGLGSLTMRALAAELNVTPMAIYYYVPNKDALIELVLDEVMSTVRVPDHSEGTWSERMWLINLACRRAIHAHPGVAEELLTRPPTPNARRLGEASLALLEEAGFGPDEARLALDTFEASMFGRALTERTNRASRNSRDYYRWTFETLVAGFEVRIAQSHR